MKLVYLTNSLQIIESLRNNSLGLSIAEISRFLGFPRSSIHNILTTFRSFDYVAQNPETNKYSRGFRFLTISHSILDYLDVRKTFFLHLRKFREMGNETVNLSVLRDGKVTYIGQVQGAIAVRLVTHIGFTTAPQATAGGKVFLSELSSKVKKAMEFRGPRYVHIDTTQCPSV
jgi:DNA-binding IclR family transcriptional regulator